MKIEISFEEKELLEELSSYFKWNKNIIFEYSHKRVSLIFSDIEDINELRELCADYLVYVGFDKDYVANNKGVMLESLIDKLYLE